LVWCRSGETSRNAGQNKKPGVKRRASPPANLAGGIARSSTAFYPVFVPNLTSMLQGRFPVSRGLRAHRPVIRHLSSIRISPYTSSRMRRIFGEFSAPPVNFTVRCGNPSRARKLPGLDENLLMSWPEPLEGEVSCDNECDCARPHRNSPTIE